MKILWTSLILAWVLSMFYNTVVYFNLNINWLFIFAWIMVLWIWEDRMKKRKIRPTMIKKG